MKAVWSKTQTTDTGRNQATCGSRRNLEPQRGNEPMTTRRNHLPVLTKLSMLLGAVAFLLSAHTANSQTGYKFDAATVSGLPARNIGSAVMSGRVAALDAIEEDGRITV